MKILPLDVISHHITNMSLQHVHVSYCKSVNGWIITVTVFGHSCGVSSFSVGTDAVSVYRTISAAAYDLSCVGVQCFSVTQLVISS